MEATLTVIVDVDCGSHFNFFNRNPSNTVIMSAPWWINGRDTRASILLLIVLSEKESDSSNAAN